MNDISLAGKRVFVTGGTGFLGRHLLPRLLKAGARVTCLVRQQSAHKDLPAGVERVEGDCLSGAGLEAAIADADIVAHMAGLLFGRGWRQYMEANCRASQNIAAALQSTKSDAHVVFVSSLAAAGPSADGVREDAPSSPVSAYGWSKYMCEQIFRAAWENNLAILRPPIIYGSGDRGLLPLFKSAKRGIAVSPGAGRKFPISIIHAADAAAAIALAASRKANGIFHLNDGASHDMDSFSQAMGKALGRKKTRVLHIPLPVMAASAAISEAASGMAAKIGGIVGLKISPAHWNMDKYREARQAGWVADASRAGRELGFEPQMNLENGMAEAVAGYRDLGWL